MDVTVSAADTLTCRFDETDAYTVYVNRALNSRGEPIRVGISITPLGEGEGTAPSAMITVDVNVAEQLASALLAIRSPSFESATITVEGGTIRSSEIRTV